MFACLLQASYMTKSAGQAPQQPVLAEGPAWGQLASHMQTRGRATAVEILCIYWSGMPLSMFMAGRH